MKTLKSSASTTPFLVFTTWIKRSVSCALLSPLIQQGRKAKWVALTGIVLLFSGYPQGTPQRPDEYCGELPVMSSSIGITDSLDSKILGRKSFPCLEDYPAPSFCCPTMIKDIESALPGAGINLIEPPQPNNLGDARLSYPIEIPPGRNGMQPDIAVQYDSSKGNGWIGIGWNIAISEITIDTRWGVPRYDAAKETETYTLDGEQLTPLAHRGSLENRSAEKVFHTRVEGEFRKIIRHGDRPNNYWWEVIHKNGTRYFYGGLPQRAGPDPQATLADPQTGNIFRWMLREVRDTWGNTISYSYEQVSDYGVASGVLPGWQIYPQEIRYTGFEQTAGPYSVRFIRDRQLPDFNIHKRSDVIINARSGFKMVTADLLKRIEVRLENDLIRRYDLEYAPGAFNKSLLTSITQYGPNGEFFHKHEFEYYDEVRDNTNLYRGFDTKTTWSTGNDGITAGLLGRGQASAIGGTSAITGGGHLYLGFNPCEASKQNSFGGKVGYSHTDSDGKLTLIDLDGDSLPDKVFKDGGVIYFRRNESGPGGNTVFGARQIVPTLTMINTLFDETSDSMTAGAEEYFPIAFMYHYRHTFTTSAAYFTDVNGDGFPDLVDHGIVWFNHPENGIPTFTLDSNDTPVPIGQGAVDATDLIDDYTDIYEQRVDNFPLLDTIRRWVAPYNGVIRIAGSVQLIEDTSSERQSYLTADGVWVTIQHNNGELWALRIEADDYNPHAPAGVDAIPVTRGDRIYFRVQSVLDGKYDQVAWNPQIEYQSVPPVGPDANLRDPYRYAASEDFVLAGRGAKTRMPYNGTIRVSGDLTKLGVTTDDITLQVLQNGTPAVELTMAWNETGAIPLMDVLEVAKGDMLEFYVKTDSPIDVTLIEWVPEIVYVDADGIPSVTDPDGNYFIRFNPPYDVDLYPEHDLTVPQEPWVAPATGAVEVVPQLMLPPPWPLADRLDGKYTTTKADAFLPGPDEEHLESKRARSIDKGLLQDRFDSELVLTVKRSGELVAKHVIQIRNGLLVPPLNFSINVVEDEEYYFDYSTRDGRTQNDNGLADKLLMRSVYVHYTDLPIGGVVPSDFHRSVVAVEEFPESFRNWSVIGYNGNRERAEHPIDESLLILDQSSTPPSAMVHLQIPYPAERKWRASDELCWVAPDVMSSSRLGMDNIAVPRPSDFAGARAVPQMSTGQEHVIAGEAFDVLSGSITLDSRSQAELDYKDMNGDQFPDIVAKHRIQYTTLTGGLEPSNRAVPNFNGIRSSKNMARNGGIGFKVGGNPASNTQTAKGDVSPSGSQRSSTTKKGSSGTRRSSATKQKSSGKQGSEMPELGFGGKLGDGWGKVEHDLVDMNGDGLPDRVRANLNNFSLEVAFNLGYSFGPFEPWDYGLIDNSSTNKASLEGNIGFNDGIYGIAGGASLTWEDDQTDVTLDDINGDGLTDLIVPSGNVFIVAFNTGAGFALGVPWQGGCNQEIATNSDITLGGGAYFTIAIGPLCWECCYIIINPGGNVDYTMARPETAFMDVNGDGYVDHVFSDRDHSLDVALNRTRRTNLLKKIIRSLGATITLEYERDGNTIDYPPSRWNLSRVEVFDGHVGDGVDNLVTTYSYQNPIYEPNERESYGYRTVTEEHRDAANADAIYRTITRTYMNDNFYDKGLLERTLLQDSAGNKFIEQVNNYVLFDINTGAPVVFPNSTTATVFPQLVRSETFFYEGQPTAGKSTYVTYQFDSFGNVIEFFDAGDTGAQDDLLVTIDYFADLASYIVDKPNGIAVTGNGIELRRREADIQGGTGAVRQVQRFLEGGHAAVTDLEYYPNGNLKRVTGPTNLHGERYAVSLEYDSEVQTYIVSIEDSFGYRSTTASYDLSYGTKDVVTDVNGNQIDYDYDVFGRLRAIRGPYQTGSTVATLEFEYHPEALVPWALTRRIDTFRDVADPIDMVVFADGLNRVVQTKEDAAIASSPGVRPEDGMIVSGRLTFDFVGRTIERYYPITEPLGTPGIFNAACDVTTPTRTQYDVLDRVTKYTYPSGLFTTCNFSFGADRENLLQFLIVATDAKGIQKQIYSNVRKLITSIRETNKGGAEVIWTSYAYNALREIVRIEDDMYNVARISYDNFGRRIATDNPDTGEIEKHYDLADNMIEKITANLRSDSQAIEYDYEFNRLKSITYPLFPDNNVSYEYGEPGVPFNRAGRITQITDQSGTEQRFYGKLGEIVKEIKTVASDTQGASPNSPEVYTTEYTYDTWNRLQKLIYPDREELTYHYDSGGLLASVTGVKDGFPTQYIRRLEYDKFKQRVYLETSNDVATRLEYDPVTRRLANLHAGAAGSEPFQNLFFTYDAVGNVLQTRNDVPVPPPRYFGGPVLQNFTYDDLHRLVEATGSYWYAPNKTNRYSFEINYDTIHNITEKTQIHELVEPSGQPIPQHTTSYSWLYSYDGLQPHAATHLDDRTFTYDENGNQLGWTHDQNGTRRTIVWDEENRIQFINDNGHTKSYKYNHIGERVIKRGPQGETVYVNRYFTVRNRSVATKHIYAGLLRVASKLSPGYFNIRPPIGLPEANFLYYYHPDHIGSSIYVTDADGELYEHLQYFPFGEAWVEEKSNIQRTPYRFTAKELDEETELYCYGTRYYDPRTSVWQNSDDVLERCLDGLIKGGVYNSKNLNLYGYKWQNPIKTR